MQRIIIQSRIPIRSGLTSTGQIRGHISFGGGRSLSHRRPDGAGAPHQQQCGPLHLKGARAATALVRRRVGLDRFERDIALME
jgi:hypothetical protein